MAEVEKAAEAEHEALSYADVLDRFNALSTTLDELSDNIADIIDDAEIPTVEPDPSEEDDKVALLDKFEAACRKVLTPDRLARLEPVLQATKQAHIELAQLSNEGIPVARAVQAERQASLTYETDWDKLIEDDIARYGWSDVVSAALVYVNKNGDQLDSLGQIIDASETTAAINKRLAAYRKPETSEQPQSQEFVHGNLGYVIDNWINLTWNALDYTNPRRRQRLSKAFPSSALRQIAMFARQAGLDGKENAAPGVIADALERAAAKRMKMFDDFDVDDIKKHQIERPNMLFIRGGNLLAETTGIDDAQTWLNRQFDDWPEWLTRGVGFIQFLPEIYEEEHIEHITPTTNEKTVTIVSTAGDWEQDANSLRISTRKKSYDRLITRELDQGHSQAEAQTIARATITKKIRRTVVHELTHNAHGNTIPLSWLREWEVTVDAEKVNVTEYIKHVRKDEGEAIAVLEDLCESAAEYRFRPAHLFAISPGRFARWQELIDGYSPYIIKKLTEAMAQLNPSDQDYEHRLDEIDDDVSKDFLKPIHYPIQNSAFTVQVDEV